MNDRLPERATPSPTRAVTVRRSGAAASGGQHDLVATELPVALVFNGISHAVMMATPTDLEAFALGFALSEGIMGSRDECRGIDVVSTPEGIEVQLEISSRAATLLKEHRRSLAGRTGCGLCGIESLKQLDLNPEPVVLPSWADALASGPLLRAFAALPAHQTLNAQTGAMHAAAWAAPDGEIEQVMEDVGRHNALDKLLGHRAMAKAKAGNSIGDGFIVMSSRASYELVRKCARMGVPVLATISAPTTLAIDIARQAGMQLYGFCRGDQAVRYAP